jgi:hypothetical protein
LAGDGRLERQTFGSGGQMMIKKDTNAGDNAGEQKEKGPAF